MPCTTLHQSLPIPVAPLQDISSGRANASTVLPEHMKEAKKDMSQWGQELKQAAQGSSLPGAAKARDLPPMSSSDSHVRDRVAVEPTQQGAQGAPNSQRKK
jgi:hypothetical protein